MRITARHLRRLIREAIIQELIQTSDGVWRDPKIAVGYDPKAALNAVEEAGQRAFLLSGVDFKTARQMAKKILDLHATIQKIITSSESMGDDIPTAKTLADEIIELSKTMRSDANSIAVIDGIILNMNSVKNSFDLSPDEVPAFTNTFSDEPA